MALAEQNLHYHKVVVGFDGIGLRLLGQQSWWHWRLANFAAIVGQHRAYFYVADVVIVAKIVAVVVAGVASVVADA